MIPGLFDAACAPYVNISKDIEGGEYYEGSKDHHP